MSSRADLESGRQSSPASDHPTWPDIEEAQAVLEAMAQIFTRETRVVGPQLNPAGTVRAPVAPPSLVGLATVDRGGTLRSLSPQAAALFGCDARDAIGQSVSLIFGDDPSSSRHSRRTAPLRARAIFAVSGAMEPRSRWDTA